jgi:DNA-binding transcriptional ArsR family regulator
VGTGSDLDLAAIGALIADRSRAAILLELLGGEPLPAGELARRTALSPSGASNQGEAYRRTGVGRG